MGRVAIEELICCKGFFGYRFHVLLRLFTLDIVQDMDSNVRISRVFLTNVISCDGKNFELLLLLITYE